MLSVGDIKDIERIALKRGSILCDRTIREMIRTGKVSNGELSLIKIKTLKKD